MSGSTIRTKARLSDARAARVRSRVRRELMQGTARVVSGTGSAISRGVLSAAGSAISLGADALREREREALAEETRSAVQEALAEALAGGRFQTRRVIRSGDALRSEFVASNGAVLRADVSEGTDGSIEIALDVADAGIERVASADGRELGRCEAELEVTRKLVDRLRSRGLVAEDPVPDDAGPAWRARREPGEGEVARERRA